MYKIFLLFAIVSLGKSPLIAQSPAIIYADSMMHTPYGDTMYTYSLPIQVSEDSSAESLHFYALLETLQYFMQEYYTDNPLPAADSVTICYNSDFSLDTVTNTTLHGGLRPVMALWPCNLRLQEKQSDILFLKCLFADLWICEFTHLQTHCLANYRYLGYAPRVSVMFFLIRIPG